MPTQSMRRKKPMSDRAVERLEEKGYLKNVRSEMRAELLKCLVEMEEQGEIPTDLRVRRYTPETDEEKQLVSLIHEFLRLHVLKNTLSCFENEINGPIEVIPLKKGKTKTTIADAIERKQAE
jgi:hypothetical protein